MQIQAELGEGHVNVIEAKEVLVTHTHLALSLEYAAGGSLTSYVADRWQHSQHSGLFLSEDEARYFFRVSVRHMAGLCTSSVLCSCSCWYMHLSSIFAACSNLLGLWSTAISIWWPTGNCRWLASCAAPMALLQASANAVYTPVYADIHLSSRLSFMVVL